MMGVTEEELGLRQSPGRSLPRELIWWREAVRFWFFAHDLLFEDGKQLRMRLPRWAGPVDLSQLNISF
jgi:hypothetical protein